MFLEGVGALNFRPRTMRTIPIEIILLDAHLQRLELLFVRFRGVAAKVVFLRTGRFILRVGFALSVAAAAAAAAAVR